MIFQDPFASLNPRMRVIDCIGEAAVVHRLIKKSEQEDESEEVNVNEEEKIEDGEEKIEEERNGEDEKQENIDLSEEETKVVEDGDN